jgi:hypothetical protein
MICLCLVSAHGINITSLDLSIVVLNDLEIGSDWCIIHMFIIDFFNGGAGATILAGGKSGCG